MGSSMRSVDTDSRSNPTLDCHTDAIILREGAGAVCSTYLDGSPSSPSVTRTPTTASESISVATPTDAEPSPFIVRRSAFRAAPQFIVHAGPATARARGRAAGAAAAGGARRAAAAAPEIRIRARSLPTWTVFAGFALGASVAAPAVIVLERGVAFAVLACVVAGVVTLFSGLTPPPRRGRVAGKPRAGTRRQ
jgi:hypothetical protein